MKHSGSPESILVVSDSYFPVRNPDRADNENGVKIPLAYARLADAVAALGSMAGIVIVDCFQSLPDDLVVAASIHLIITPRGHVAVASGKALTINGRVTILTSAPFAGPGSVVYGANAMRNVMGPANMSGMAGKALIINAGEDGFVWGDIGGPGGGGEEFKVGDVFISTIPENPLIRKGYGTWVAIGTGRMLIGFDAGDPDFNAPEKTGGEKAHTLTVAEMPSHAHAENAPSAASGGAVRLATDTNASGSINSTLSTEGAGGGGAHNNLPPYIVVYIWKRTA